MALAVLLGGVLFALAGVHLYWAFGGRWPGHDEASMVEHVVGRTRGMRAPGPAASIAVALALAVGGVLVAATLLPPTRWDRLAWPGLDARCCSPSSPDAARRPMFRPSFAMPRARRSRG